MNIRNVVLTGIAFGSLGAIGQGVLARQGVLFAPPLEIVLTLVVPLAIGVLIGTRSPRNPLWTAAVAGLIAAFPATLVQVGFLLARSSPSGQSPVSSVEVFLTFAGTVLACTVIFSWILSGLAALVALGCAQNS